MAKLTSYLEKRRLMDQLAAELQALEEDQGVQEELKFEQDLKNLLDQYGFSAKHAYQVLTAADQAASGSGDEAEKPKRPMKTYKNPHTGEVVKTRGGNHKTLREWRTEYGQEAVANWANDQD